MGNNGHSAIDTLLALNDIKNMNFKALSDSLKQKAQDYTYAGNPAIAAQMGQGFDFPRISVFKQRENSFPTPSLKEIFDQEGVKYDDIGMGYYYNNVLEPLFTISGKDPKGGGVADMLYQALSGQSYADYPESRIPFATPSNNKSMALKDLPTFTPRPANILDIIQFIQSMPGSKKSSFYKDKK